MIYVKNGILLQSLSGKMPGSVNTSNPVNSDNSYNSAAAVTMYRDSYEIP